MPKRSVKEDKNVYQILRESCGYSRAKASECLQCISDSRLIRIESGEVTPYPEEIITMSKVYGEPNLPNIYCSTDCPLGREYVTQVEAKDLPVITLEMLNLLNRLTKQKDRLIEITVDGKITENELKDFNAIRKDLEKMSMAIDSMQLWIENMIAAGEIDQEGLE